MQKSKLVRLDIVAVSKATSHALRHEPWLYELELDDEGWTSVEPLLTSLRQERSEWSELSSDDLAQMIAESSKQRHEIRDGRIRALYGHSIPGKLKRTPASPPGVLFHGTDPNAVPQITIKGLLPMNRQYVHLSIDRAMAVAVGRRKSKTPVILRISATQAYACGIHFYQGNDKVWLADTVPSEFLQLDDEG